MDTLSVVSSTSSTIHKATLRNLQPRAAALIEFHESDEDDDDSISGNGSNGSGRRRITTSGRGMGAASNASANGNGGGGAIGIGIGAGGLSAEYRALRKTTEDLVDFFKNAPPPPSSPATLLMVPRPLAVDEKKKRTLLQKLRSRKSNLGSMSFGGSTHSRDRDRNSVHVPPTQGRGTVSSVSTASRGEVATLPNGKKYVMIAVDYKDSKTPSNISAIAGAASVRTPSTINPAIGRPILGKDRDVGVKSESILSANPLIQVTTAIENDKIQNGNNHHSNSNSHGGNSKHVQNGSQRTSFGSDNRRSPTIQAGTGEGSLSILDSAPFLLDNFSLDSEYIADQSKSRQQQHQHQHQQTQQPLHNHLGSRRTSSSKSGKIQRGTSETGSKRSTRVTFNIADSQENQTSMDEDTLSKALAGRIANHKAQIAKGMVPQDSTSAAAADTNATLESTTAQQQARTRISDIQLPKPVTRKKVRHVQIQTQHCIMRPMHTQTEPIESLTRETAVKEFSTQTTMTAEGSTASVVSGSMDVGTSTDTETTVGSLKVASLVASFSQSPATRTTSTSTSSSSSTSTSTITTTTSVSTATTTGSSLPDKSAPLSTAEQQELLQLRQQNATLQAQVATLQRDLAAETRARTRTAVAMQDTRDKFEMLSAMAYKKLKEMIFQRHVLEMEVRELRAQVDIQTEVHRQEGEYDDEYEDSYGYEDAESESAYYRQQYPQHEYITIGLQ
ncbi:hypothetical protein BGZ99_005343 [Dissophora globulifera]|uniref:Uncharacterized protein n=1 Tax=Dissophora globulifera TaxID=979702 RepID=A0A9P6RHV6_9FUNG|nr:hypothetical protein BGZ99_005343 [Dissophora globulifera]